MARAIIVQIMFSEVCSWAYLFRSSLYMYIKTVCADNNMMSLTFDQT